MSVCPPGTLQQLISETMVRWAQESVIEDPELVRAMFVLLHRQYDGIGTLPYETSPPNPAEGIPCKAWASCV